jgi:hypothetical protein
MWPLRVTGEFENALHNLVLDIVNHCFGKAVVEERKLLRASDVPTLTEWLDAEREELNVISGRPRESRPLPVRDEDVYAGGPDTSMYRESE